MELHAGNRLIAEYDGWKFAAITPEDEAVFTCRPPVIGHLDVTRLNTMEYHKSWDWLMPVLIKISKESPIETSDTASPPIRMEMFNDGCEFIYQYHKGGAFAKDSENPIQALWDFVVQYLENKSRRER